MAKRFVSQFDGHPARRSGPWASEKLYYVERYLDAFVTAMRKKKWKALAYIDLMAGGGICKVKETGEEFPGSPLRSAQLDFERLIFVENSGRLLDALKKRLPADDARLSFVHGDCNSDGVISAVRSWFPSGALGVMFVDNLGLNVTMATLRRLSEQPVRADLLITVMSQDLTRNLGEALAGDPRHAPRFDAFFGTGSWREALHGPGSDVDRLEQFYVEQLGSLGYDHCRYSPTSMRNSKGGELYRVMLASRHQAATTLFDRIASIRPSGQRSFF